MSDAGWLKCVQEFPGDQQIFDRFEDLFLKAGGPTEAALFSRQDHKTHTYLMSPAAAKWAPLLPGQWETASDPRSSRWAFLVGDARAPDALGIALGQHREEP